MAESKQSNPQQDIFKEFTKEHKSYIEELKNRGLFSRKLKLALEELMYSYEGLSQYHGRSLEKMEKELTSYNLQSFKDFWKVIRKVYRLSPIDPATGQPLYHPLVAEWIKTYRTLGFREVLRMRDKRVLEKGIKRPMSPDEIKLYIRVDDLHEESSDYSRYKIYEKVKEEGLYKGSYVSFNKWLSRNGIAIEQKRGPRKKG